MHIQTSEFQVELLLLFHREERDSDREKERERERGFLKVTFNKDKMFYIQKKLRNKHTHSLRLNSNSELYLHELRQESRSSFTSVVKTVSASWCLCEAPEHCEIAGW